MTNEDTATELDSNYLNLAAQLAERFASFRTSAETLFAFVAASEAMIEKEHAQWPRVAESVTKRLEDHRAGKRIDPTEPIPNDQVQLNLSEKETEALIEWTSKQAAYVQSYPGYVYNMAVIYALALWEACVSDCIRLVLVTRPEILRLRSKKVSYAELLQHESMEKIVEYLAEREVMQSAHESMEDRLSELNDRYHVDTSTLSGFPHAYLVEADARRNLLVHNNGVVNGVYLRKVPPSNLATGDRVDADQDYWKQAFALLYDSAGYISAELQSGFCKIRTPVEIDEDSDA